MARTARGEHNTLIFVHFVGFGKIMYGIEKKKKKIQTKPNRK